jgi:hypothetical protein
MGVIIYRTVRILPRNILIGNYIIILVIICAYIQIHGQGTNNMP